MSVIEVLSSVRVGQLTGSTRTSEPKWETPVDPLGWPLLNDTGHWGVMGADLGANTEHSDGRLYFFTGDVAVEWDRNFPGYSGAPVIKNNADPKKPFDLMSNADLVAWTDDREVLRHGGHLAIGWNFFLPNDHQGATAASGQKDWRFCSKCGGLFWAPNGQGAGICLKGGAHDPIGWNFFLPNDHQGATNATGQKDWRFCAKCHTLFWAPAGNPAGTCCPADGAAHSPIGWNFSLPNDHQGATDTTGQKQWRFCCNCHALFWNGDAFKGLCPAAPGGGFHLHAVLRDEGPFKGKFAPLNAQEPIGLTNSFETPSGAFSYNGRVYVFVGMAETKYSKRVRFGDPAYGLYLVSNDNPVSAGKMRSDVNLPPTYDYPATYKKEFLVSPRMGCCPKDSSRSLFESHEIMGYKFILPQVVRAENTGRNNWRLCKKCEAVFWDNNLSGVCWKGGRHEADGPAYALSNGVAEDATHQSNWRKCQKCTQLFWDGDPNNKGLCAGGGNHNGTGPALLIQHISEAADPHSNGDWRFCIKCYAMVKANQADVFPGVAACVVDNADHNLPGRAGKGVVMITRNWQMPALGSGFRLAWMPLRRNEGPRLQDMVYYTGVSGQWSPDPYKAGMLFPHPSNFYTSISFAWLDGPRRWLLLYSNSNPDSTNLTDLKGPVIARTSPNLFDWSEPTNIFDPDPAHNTDAYGKYMHFPGLDSINLTVPPLPPLDPTSPTGRDVSAGCAYGAFIINRFTKWNEATRVLDIYYLLSTRRPYQVQLMHSVLRLWD
jgi:hypothetical protein